MAFLNTAVNAAVTQHDTYMQLHEIVTDDLHCATSRVNGICEAPLCSPATKSACSVQISITFSARMVNTQQHHAIFQHHAIYQPNITDPKQRQCTTCPNVCFLRQMPIQQSCKREVIDPISVSFWIALVYSFDAEIGLKTMQSFTWKTKCFIGVQQQSCVLCRSMTLFRVR